MFKGWKFLTSFCVMFATLCGGAYGAASVRGGTTGRAGSLRTLGGGTTATVKTNVNQPAPSVAVTGDASVADSSRMVTGISTGRTKLNLASTAGTFGSQNLDELRQAIAQLRSDYDALGGQYDSLSGDIAAVSDTAQNANLTAESNANTLVVVRSDLNDAQADIEVLKANGGFDETRVQQTVQGMLDTKNYATQSQLAATDVIARGAVQLNDLPQKLNALNIADRDYVDTMVATGMDETQVQGIVNDSLNNTMANYYTKKQVNDAINTAKSGMVDKDYVDYQVQTSVGDKASYSYVDQKVATGMNEAQVQGIIGNVLGNTLENYYDKGTVDSLVDAAIVDAKNGMVDKDYVDNQVRDMASKDWVNNKITDIEIGVDEYEIRNILAQGDYKTGTQVQGIVTDALNGALENYYTRPQVNKAISDAKEGMVGMDQLNYQLSGLAPKSWVTTQIDSAVENLDLGLNRDAVKGVVEEYGYKNENDVRGIITGYGYAKADDIPTMIAELAPGAADLEYSGGVLQFIDKNGDRQTIDIRGLDGQDGAQIELRKNDGQIQWHYTSGDDQSWHDLIKISDLVGEDGKSIELDVQSMSLYGQSIKSALVYRKEGESNWQFLYNLDDINGADGCGVKATQTSVDGGTLVKLLRDCAGQPGDGDLLTQFTILNGADGTVSEEEIVRALESSDAFTQLWRVKTDVNNPDTGLEATRNVAVSTATAVNDVTTGLEKTHELASNAWDKVKDLDTNVTTKDYVNSYVNGKIGELDYNPATYAKFASVGAKLGSIGNMTVKDYVDAKVRGITTEIMVDKGYDGFTYICKNGNTCTNKPSYWDNQWERIDVDLTGYLKQETADNLYASFGTEVVARDAATAAANAQTTANNAWNKVKDLGDGVTVSDYVDERIGTMGFDILTGSEYTVAKKIGLDDRQYGSMSVKEYVDKKVSDVNTSIQIGSYNNQTYICKHNDCKTPAGPYYPEDWALISVDLSGYLTRNDAEKEYASIETESIAGAAQTAATQAQATATAAQNAITQVQNAASEAKTTATAAQTTADKAWEKLSDLPGYQTVRQYVEDKISSGTGNSGSGNTSIEVETYEGTTYICRTGNGCNTPIGSYLSQWQPITVSATGYFTEEQADNKYALKTQIGSLGGSFTSVADKIGLNDGYSSDSNKTVKQYVIDYVAAQLGNVSTDIQIETSNGTTYICKKGSGCPTDLTNTTYWAPVAVNLGDLGTNPSTYKTYTVADKIGLNGSNLNKTVVGYIGDRIGTLGTNPSTNAEYSVKDYLTAYYAPLTKIGELGAPSTYGSTPYTVETKIGLNGNNASKTVVQYISDQIGDLGYSYSTGAQYTVKSYLEDKYALKSSIGTLGTNTYSSTPYTVETKIGLNSGNDANQTVKGYVDGKIGVLGDNYASVAAKLGAEIGQSQTVAQYIQSKVDGVNTTIKIGTYNNTTYICKTGTCLTNNPDPINYPGDFSNWVPLQVDVSGYLTQTAANDLYAPLRVKTAVEDEIKGLDATYTLASSASAAAATADAKATNAANAATTAQSKADDAWNKVKGLDDVSGWNASNKDVVNYVGYKLGSEIGANQTVADYIANYVAQNATSGGVTVQTFNVGGVNKTYICSDKCTVIPPCAYPNACGWQELNIDISSKANQSDMDAVENILDGFGLGTGQDATVKSYVNDRIGSLGTVIVDGDVINARSVAEKIGTEITSSNKTIAGYIANYVAQNTTSGGVQVKTFGVDTYICSENCDMANTPPCPVGTESTCGWQKLEVDLTEYLKSSVAASTYATISDVNEALNDKADKTTLNDYATISYVDNTKIGDLGKKDNSTNAASVAEKLGTDITSYDGTVKDYIAYYVSENAASGGVTVTTGTDGNTYICSENCEDTPPCSGSNCGWQKLEVNLTEYLKSSVAASTYATISNVNTALDAKADRTMLNDYATKQYVGDSIGALGAPSGSDTPYTVASKIGAIPATQTIREYIDNHTPSIDVRNGTESGHENDLYICTKSSCDDSVIPGAGDSGWKYLDVAGAVDLSQYLTKAAAEQEYLTKTDAADTYLNKTGELKLERSGQNIMISGGGIETPYKIADVTDFMCTSYRMEQLTSGDPGYDANKVSYRLICETVGD